MRFRDRAEAGRRLAGALRDRIHGQDPVVLALPPGGVPVAAELARGLGLPWDVLLVRKLGLPWQPEMGVGAVARGGHVVLNHELLRALEFDDQDLDRICHNERMELARLEALFRGARPFPDLRGRRAILVDDGLMTGCNVKAALRAVREAGAEAVTVAVPVAPPEVLASLATEAEVCCLHSPWLFLCLSGFYQDFHPVTDEEVLAILEVGAVA